MILIFDMEYRIFRLRTVCYIMIQNVDFVMNLRLSGRCSDTGLLRRIFSRTSAPVVSHLRNSVFRPWLALPIKVAMRGITSKAVNAGREPPDTCLSSMWTRTRGRHGVLSRSYRHRNPYDFYPDDGAPNVEKGVFGMDEFSKQQCVEKGGGADIDGYVCACNNQEDACL